MTGNLNKREKNLIAVMLALLVFFLGGIVLQKLNGGRATLEADLAKAQEQLKKLSRIEQELIYLQGLSNAPVMGLPLGNFIENGALVFQLKNKLQLNALTANLPPGTEGVRVQMDQLNLDELYEMLYFLENNEPVVLVEMLEVNKIPGSTKIRTSFRVIKQAKT